MMAAMCAVAVARHAVRLLCVQRMESRLSRRPRTEPAEKVPARREVFEDPQLRAPAHDRAEKARAIWSQRVPLPIIGWRREIEVRGRRAADHADVAGADIDRDYLDGAGVSAPGRVQGGTVTRPDQCAAGSRCEDFASGAVRADEFYTAQHAICDPFVI